MTKCRASNCITSLGLIFIGLFQFFIGTSFAAATATQQQVADYVRLVILGGNFGDVNLWITEGPLDPSYVVRDIKVGVPDTPFPFAQSWLVMIDEEPSANWGHACRWLFVDDSLTTNTLPLQKYWFPTIWANGGAGPEIPFGCVNLTPVPCGGPPPPVPPLPEPPEDGIPRAVDKNCLWAVLVCGGWNRGHCREPGPVCPPACPPNTDCGSFTGAAPFHCFTRCEGNDYGICASCTGCNNKRYVDNLRSMYAKLRNCGYPKNHIFVFYSDGTVPLDLDNADGDNNDATGSEVTGSASEANIRNGQGPNNSPQGIKKLCQSLNPLTDILFIYVTNHGSRQTCVDNVTKADMGIAGSGGACPPGSTVQGQDGICLWNFNQDGKMDPSECYSPAEFSDDTKGCLACRLFVVMDQCFSGQFLHTAVDGEHRNMAIYASASPNEESWGRDYMSGWEQADPAVSSLDDMHRKAELQLILNGKACEGGPNSGQPCNGDSDCSPGGCYVQWECVGGSNDGAACLHNSHCGDGYCEAKRHCVGGTAPGTRCTGVASMPCPGGGACVTNRPTSVPDSREGTIGLGGQSLCECCVHPTKVLDCLRTFLNGLLFSSGSWLRNGVPIGGSFSNGLSPPIGIWNCEMDQLSNEPNEWNWSADYDCANPAFHFDAHIGGFVRTDRIKVRLICSPFYAGAKLTVNVGANTYSLSGPINEPIYSGQWTGYPGNIPSGFGFYEVGAERQNYSDCTTCPGDMNGDGFVRAADIPDFVIALVDEVPNLCADDFPDGRIDGKDIQIFINMILANGGQGINCPP